jgi:rhodanese-related sulfurtransferase
MSASEISMQTHTPILEDLFPTEAQSLIPKRNGTRDLIILDVCTPKEFARLHLENAVNLNFFSRGFKARLNALDKRKAYLVYCKVGGRSKMAQRRMKRLGFREVYNIVGGSLLWAEEGLPFAPGLEKPPKFSLCPVTLSIKLMLKVRRFFKDKNRSLSSVHRRTVS